MVTLNAWISNRYEQFTWIKNPKQQVGDSIVIQRLPEQDFSEEGERSIETTVDCYVTGSYVDQQKGKVFQIRQRYSIDITYSNSSLVRSTNFVRQEIIRRFEQDNDNFSINEVIIPDLRKIVPEAPDPILFTGGSRIWKRITRVEEGKLALRREKDIYKSRARRLIERYGLKRRDVQIRRI